ncbi:thioredoxin domain-containing protein [Opitutaceae bacterium]
MPNALAGEKSPYLRQHADNPVAWLPWGDAAFARAKAEQKPIFLSIGYATCHWCHVMAHESFENAATAELLNTHFIPVKVDREERPDVDRVYMTYVQALTGHGGWPLSAWLTPDLKPFYGGTYFPPQDRQGRPGFPTLLNAIAKGWINEREKLVAESHRVIDALRESLQPAPTDGSRVDADLTEAAGDAFERCYQHLYENHDATNGGFGGAPKFPRASNLTFLFRAAAVQGPESETGREALVMAEATLAAMARGGIHDQVGGGFHRYAVDEAWFVPHFEKMLYDQAQIAVNALDAHAFTGRETYAWLARDILEYVLRDLTAPQGGFYAAEDADSLPPVSAAHTDAKENHAIEGAFYVWTKVDFDAVLGDDAGWVGAHFGVEPQGNVPAALDPHGELRGQNILRQRRSIVESARVLGVTPEHAAHRLVAALEKLRTVRSRRPRPLRDEKIITAWNGLMIGAFARAATSTAGCLDDRKAAYLAAAVRAAEFVRDELYDESRGVLHRCWLGGPSSVEGFAEDYAQLIAGLLDLYEAGFDYRWLQWAETLQRTMDRLFWDEAAGGYFNSAAGDTAIILRLKDDYDGAEPTPNSTAAVNLYRLAWMLGDDALAQRGRRTLVALQPRWSSHPHAMPHLLGALEFALHPPRTVVLAGDARSTEFADLVGAPRARPGVRIAILHADGGAGQAWLAERLPHLRAVGPVQGRPAAYVCEHFSCRPPVTKKEELALALA